MGLKETVDQQFVSLAYINLTEVVGKVEQFVRMQSESSLYLWGHLYKCYFGHLLENLDPLLPVCGAACIRCSKEHDALGRPVDCASVISRIVSGENKSL